MTTLLPAPLRLADWLDLDLPFAEEGLIQIEDQLTDREYRLSAELPGIDPAKDVQVNVDRGVLTIHAERREQKETPARSEFRYGMLERSVRLPSNADADQITASYTNGILLVSVPLTGMAPTGKQIAVTHD